MPRLFAAIEIPHNAAMSLSLLRGGLPGARWIDIENYHLTLRFIGDVEHHVADEFADALGRIRRFEFKMGLSGLGCFGGKKPHSLAIVATRTIASEPVSPSLPLYPSLPYGMPPCRG